MTETDVRAIYADLDAAEAALKAIRERVTAVLMRAGDGQDFLVQSCQSKRRYKTIEGAGAAAAAAKAKSGDALRIYPCGLCAGFHLTKGDLEEFARRAG